MRTIEQIEAEMEDVNRRRAPLLRRMDELVRERAQVRSLQWIQANGCRREDVAFSTRRAGSLRQFADQLRGSKCQKPFCAWGGKIYRTDLIVDGRFDPNPPGRVEDLPE